MTRKFLVLGAGASLALLPLSAATLSCGEGLVVIFDTEGYTVKPTPKPAAHCESAALQSGVAGWQAGANGCDQFISDSEVVESVTVNGVTVQVSLHDTGWRLRADVTVANMGSEHLYVNPAKFRLNEAASWKSLPQDPAQLVETTTHQVNEC